jgi:hypothetical protein
MGNSIKLVFFIIIFFAFQHNLLAQDGNSSEAKGGSVYSAIGVGFPIDNTSSSLLAQGIVGVTNINRKTSSLANPGLWGNTFFTQAGTGFQLTQSLTEHLNSNTKSVNLETGYLHALFPLKPGKVALSLGLYPVTRANFKSKSTLSLNPKVDYVNEVQSYGGINKFEIGFGFKLGEYFSFGYAPSLAFLTLKNTQRFSFLSSEFQNYSQEINFNGATFSQRLGLTATFENLISEKDRISLGVSINLPYSFRVSNNKTSLKKIEGRLEEIKLENVIDKGDITLPFEAAFGLGYTANAITNFSIETQIQNWSDFKNEFDQSSELNTKDRFRIGFGGQYHPYRTNSSYFLSNFKYSAGISYDTGHLKISDQEIKTLWLNTGIGIPSKVSSFVDISIRYGIRGTTANNLFKERIWELGLSINLTELMFVRPKLR